MSENNQKYSMDKGYLEAESRAAAEFLDQLEKYDMELASDYNSTPALFLSKIPIVDVNFNAGHTRIGEAILPPDDSARQYLSENLEELNEKIHEL